MTLKGRAYYKGDAYWKEGTKYFHSFDVLIGKVQSLFNFLVYNRQRTFSLNCTKSERKKTNMRLTHPNYITIHITEEKESTGACFT